MRYLNVFSCRAATRCPVGAIKSSMASGTGSHAHGVIRPNATVCHLLSSPSTARIAAPYLMKTAHGSVLVARVI